ncbi:MAG: T9SS type A sorting domain-containing protein [Bacteroidetes bacterium]|nr:T9SS type A sorting domain-containing protein [Bacteroidota bacterium]
MDYGNSVVKKGSFELENNTTSQTVAVSGGIPNPDKSWLIYNYWNNTNTSQQVSKLLIKGAISGDNVVFDRNVTTSSSYDVYGTYYLVEFTDSTKVQHANMTFSATSKEESATLTRQVNRGCAIPVVGYHQRGGKAGSSLTNFAPGWFSAELADNGNEITLTRGESNNVTAEAYWFVLEFDWCPPAPFDEGYGLNTQPVQPMIHNLGANITDNYIFGGTPSQGGTISNPILGVGHNSTVDIDFDTYLGGGPPKGLEDRVAYPDGQSSNELSVFPNPVSKTGTIHIASQNSYGAQHELNSNVRLIGVDGRFTWERNIINNSLDLSSLNLQSGFYMLMIQNGTNTLTEKVVVVD